MHAYQLAQGEHVNLYELYAVFMGETVHSTYAHNRATYSTIMH